MLCEHTGDLMRNGKKINTARTATTTSSSSGANSNNNEAEEELRDGIISHSLFAYKGNIINLRNSYIFDCCLLLVFKHFSPRNDTAKRTSRETRRPKEDAKNLIINEKIHYLWSLRWSCRRKAFPHISQLYGRSSVCVRSWIRRLYDFVNCRLQNLHINCFFGLCVALDDDVMLCETTDDAVACVDVMDDFASDAATPAAANEHNGAVFALSSISVFLFNSSWLNFCRNDELINKLG